jgi:DNA polymerase elongation subunit (family B)
MARFSDFDHAEKVAAEGRKLLEFMIEWLREEHAEPIEIDTDGIYFVPPEYENRKELEAFRKRMQEALPEGIEIEFDGEYEAMFSYKMKNYALLEKNGELVIKGAALKSRGLEPFQRAFLRDMLRLKLEGRGEEIEALKNEYGQAILRGKWPIQKLAKTEQLQDAPSTYESKIKAKKRGRNAAYELALASDREYTAGDRIAYYVTGNKKSVPVYANAKPVSEWNPDQRDENVPYYLAKLDALYKKFVD